LALLANYDVFFHQLKKDIGTLVVNSVECNQKIGALLADPEGSPGACFFSRCPH